MHMQIIIKFHWFCLKILSVNKIKQISDASRRPYLCYGLAQTDD